MDLATHFGRNLFLCRRRTGLSQEELAIRASLHRTEISMLERGLRLARVDTLVKLTGTLEISADSLLSGVTWEPGRSEAGKFALSSTRAVLRTDQTKSR
jgi:transcriptional regulator with XRE-family HTH domain